jgi:hypothetical protein
LVDVTPDGSVWLSSDTGSSGLFRLGEEPVFEDVDILPPYLEVAPDGSLWAIGEVSDDHRGIFSFDDEGWTLRATTMVVPHALAIGPDGTVWVAGIDGDKHCPDIEDDGCAGTVLFRLEDDGSPTTIEDWSDVYDGDAHWLQLAVSPDGDVWLIGESDDPQVAGAVLRFDGEGWEAIPGPEGWAPGEMGRSLANGPAGTHWVVATRDDGEWNRGDLARYDDAGWTTFTDADGVEPWGDMAWAWAYMDLPTVAADGSLWLQGIETVTDEGHCGGAAHYDGTTWTSYLGDSCIRDLAIAPDGSAWLRADSGTSVATYVITPEAVAGTE